MTDLRIAPPIPLKETGFPDGCNSGPGMPYIIGFIDLRQHPNSPPAMHGAEAHPGKPWIVVVHELPERANRWWKYHATLHDAASDALHCGLLTVEAAQEIEQNPRCEPEKMLVFGGIIQHPQVSLASFEPCHSAAVDSWESLKPTLQQDAVLALAPATEIPC